MNDVCRLVEVLRSSSEYRSVSFFCWYIYIFLLPILFFRICFFTWYISQRFSNINSLLLEFSHLLFSSLFESVHINISIERDINIFHVYLNEFPMQEFKSYCNVKAFIEYIKQGVKCLKTFRWFELYYVVLLMAIYIGKKIVHLVDSQDQLCKKNLYEIRISANSLRWKIETKIML